MDHGVGALSGKGYVKVVSKGIMRAQLSLC